MSRDVHRGRANADRPRMGQVALRVLRRWFWMALVPLLVLGCGGGSDRTDHAVPAATADLRSKAVKAVSSAPAFATPETGWYWNPAEGGTGFMFEAQGNRAFVGFFMYEEGTGVPIWYAAFGDMTTEAGAPVFTGDLRLYVDAAGGITSSSLGPVRVVFDGRKATVSLPGGRTMPATRFDIAGSGYDFDRATPITREQPEAGWYWDPARPGSGYAIEVQNNRLFLGIFDYSEFGMPTWSIVDSHLEAGIAAASTTRYADGQSLTSAHRSPYASRNGFATLSFPNSCTGRIQRDFSPTIDVRRFRVDDSPLPPGAECRAAALGGLATPGGSTKDAMRLRLGETVEAELRTPGEVHVYAVVFPYGGAIEPTSYGFTLESAASGRGSSLASPLLSVHGPDGSRSPTTQSWSYQQEDFSSTLRCSTDRSGGCINQYYALIQVPGVYYIVVRAADRGTGTYRLVTSNSTLDENIRQSAREFVSKSAAGPYVGRVTGRLGGSLDILFDGNGAAQGTWTQASASGSPERVPLTGLVSEEYVRLAGPAGLQFLGRLAPVDGVFTGVWQDSNGPGGVFATTSDHVPQEIVGGVVGPSTVQAGMAEFFRAEHLPSQWRYLGIGSRRFLPEQYRWRVISAPAGSRPQLFSPQGHSNWFTADLPGAYTLEVSLSEKNGRVTTSSRTVTAFAPPVLAFYDPATNPVSLAFVEPTSQDKLTELDTDVPVALQLLLNGTPSNSDRTGHQTITLSSDNPAIRVLGGPMRLVWPRADGRAVFTLRSCTGGSAQLSAVSSGQYGSSYTVPIQMRVEVPPSRAAC